MQMEVKNERRMIEQRNGTSNSSTSVSSLRAGKAKDTNDCTHQRLTASVLRYPSFVLPFSSLDEFNLHSKLGWAVKESLERRNLALKPRSLTQDYDLRSEIFMSKSPMKVEEPSTSMELCTLVLVFPSFSCGNN
ncbi:CLUMA_CG019199, isoform A [Clunio marinus]|uniref:CLUMA_CG019199, isoform A n=1 Tax=Clunio marinus TaxID=568069 RepID=A0A1J1J190_9DIPT|nr:CLUMA_CG019199, isoform A [Clunio marinus]